MTALPVRGICRCGCGDTSRNDDNRDKAAGKIDHGVRSPAFDEPALKPVCYCSAEWARPVLHLVDGRRQVNSAISSFCWALSEGPFTGLGVVSLRSGLPVAGITMRLHGSAILQEHLAREVTPIGGHPGGDCPDLSNARRRVVRLVSTRRPQLPGERQHALFDAAVRHQWLICKESVWTPARLRRFHRGGVGVVVTPAFHLALLAAPRATSVASSIAQIVDLQGSTLSVMSRCVLLNCASLLPVWTPETSSQ
jgi:hypothetical protein